MTDNSQNVERSVQIALAVTAALGTLLLGLGQQSVFLPCLAILAAVGSLVLTDSLGTFRLNRNLANMGALLAVSYTVGIFIYGMFDGGQDDQAALIKVANLLVYLQIVLQFQEKSLRIYWSLSVLSLLQVVVASALNLSVSFGPLLVVYLLVALTALCLLFVHRETMRFHDGRPMDKMAAAGPPRRWPLAGLAVRFSGVAGEDLARPLLGRRMAMQVAAMGLITLVVTALVFFGVPRYDRGTLPSSGRRGTTVTGFSDEVSLGEMGRILQSDEEVLRATFLHADNRRPFRVDGEPYLRGATLTRYRNGSWTHGGGNGHSVHIETLAVDRTLRGRVIQDISLDTPLRPGAAGRYTILFSSYPVYLDAPVPHRLEVDRNRRQLLVDNTSLPDIVPQFHYSVRSGAFRGSSMARITPELSNKTYPELAILDANDGARLPELIADAQSIVDDAGAENPLDKALALESHFLYPNRYDYDLDPDVTPTPGVDPVEDFVANHRTGHCEYFASAMVLMLRSQGIPARMVVGYRSGEYNSVGGYYQFRERHAHAWAEAYLAPGQFNAGQMAEGDAVSGDQGVWMRLDPTPADYDAEAEFAEGDLIARFYDMVDYGQILWDDYVLGLNSQRQNESIYHPIAEGFQCFRQSLAAAIARHGQLLTIVMLVISALSFLLLSWRLTSRRGRAKTSMARDVNPLAAPLRWISSWLAAGAGASVPARGVRIDFYQRLERILQRHGLTRQPGQTQREFAAAAGGVLADAPQLQAVAGVPRRVAQVFYQVRFGRLPLDSAQQQAVEQSLRDLEAALAKAN